jgi:hypothetical protein
MKRRFTLVLIILVVAITATTVNQAFRPSNSIRTKGQKNADKTVWPITDYVVTLPTDDPAKREKRNARNKRYNKSHFRVHPDDPGENTTLVDAADQKQPALPLYPSVVVLIGSVNEAQAFLSEDRTGVYSEFNISVERILKRSDQGSMLRSVVEVERQGGRVKFASGKVHWYSVDKENMPLVGKRYVFFLDGDVNGDLQILTAYQLENGKVIPLDELPQFRLFDGKDEAEFLNTLQTAVSNSK